MSDVKKTFYNGKVTITVLMVVTATSGNCELVLPTLRVRIVRNGMAYFHVASKVSRCSRNFRHGAVTQRSQKAVRQ